MPSRRKTEAAVTSLKSALVKHFGEGFADVIDAEVNARLRSAHEGRLSREDIDAVERAVVASKRVREGTACKASAAVLGDAAIKVPRRTRSMPSLPCAKRDVDLNCRAKPLASSQRALPKEQLSVAPPPLPNNAPACPSSQSRPPSSTAASLRGLLAPVRPVLVNPGPPLQPTPHPSRNNRKGGKAEPPYGVAIMADDEDAVSEKSGVQANPKFPVPLRPRFKAMDHWDVIVAYDTQKHVLEHDAFVKAGKVAAVEKQRHRLDGQMEEIRQIRDDEAERLRMEREEMLAMVEENRRLDAAEAKQRHDRREDMKRITDDMLADINRKRKREEDRKKRDENMMTAWLKNERERKEEHERIQAEEFRKKCEAMKAEIAEVVKMKQAQKTEAMSYSSAEQCKEMEDRAKADRAAVQARMDQIDRNCSTLGAEIAGRDAEAERQLLEKIKRVQEESNRASKEDAERRKNDHNRRTREMLNKLGDQMKERAERSKIEKQEGKHQAELFKADCERGLKKDRDEAERRRQARAVQDRTFIAQMRSSLAVHPRNYLVTGPEQRTEVAYNRIMFERMKAEGFMTDTADKMLAHGYHKGKIDPFPSVGRYEGKIEEHELKELEVP